MKLRLEVPLATFGTLYRILKPYQTKFLSIGPS